MAGRAAAALVRAYQMTVGRLLSGRCRFHPTCSEYAVQALRVNGLLRGSAQAAWRVLRCGPWTAGGIDHVKPSARRARRLRGSHAHG